MFWLCFDGLAVSAASVHHGGGLQVAVGLKKVSSGSIREEVKGLGLRKAYRGGLVKALTYHI